MELELEVVSAQGETLARSAGNGFVNLVYSQEYAPGDRLVLTAPASPARLLVQLDSGLTPALVYLPGGRYEYPVPLGEKHKPYPPGAFAGGLHLLRAREATPGEVGLCRNLALNSHDCHENGSCYPHASANVETRGESVFAAANAIDGNTENRSHGSWPYESWGINRDPDAELTVDFGRTVEIDRVVLVTRADFPHDNWWKSAELAFSDGSALEAEMEKSAAPHGFSFAKKRVSWVRLRKLRKDENDPSDFPALSQIEIFGRELAEK